MIGLVDGLGDVGGTDAVAYLANERGTAAEGIHVGTVGALAQGADDRLTRKRALGPKGRFACKEQASRKPAKT